LDRRDRDRAIALPAEDPGEGAFVMEGAGTRRIPAAPAGQGETTRANTCCMPNAKRSAPADCANPRICATESPLARLSSTSKRIS